TSSRACDAQSPRAAPPLLRYRRMSRPSDPLHGEGNTLADPDAHRTQRPPAAGALQLIHGSGGEPRTAHAERMAERDGPPLRIHMSRIIGDSQLPQHREPLGGESLVELDQVEIVDGQP